MARRKQESEGEILEKINIKLDKLLAVLLVKFGLSKRETAKAIGVTGRTIQNWIPVNKLKKRND